MRKLKIIQKIKGNLEELSKNMSFMTAEEFSEGLSNLGFSENVSSEVYAKITEQFLEINKARDQAALKAARLIQGSRSKAFDSMPQYIADGMMGVENGAAYSLLSEEFAQDTLNAFLSGQGLFAQYLTEKGVDPSAIAAITQYFSNLLGGLETDTVMFQKARL